MTDSVHSANAETRSVQGHTPGPWAVSQNHYLLFGKPHGPGLEPLGFVYGPAIPENSEVGRRALADMRLIAAAPELKEQLATMTALLRIKCGNLEPDVFAEILKSEAVLAKATGAAP